MVWYFSLSEAPMDTSNTQPDVIERNAALTPIPTISHMQQARSTPEKEISGSKCSHVSEGSNYDKEPLANINENQMVIVTSTPSKVGKNIFSLCSMNNSSEHLAKY